MDKNIFSTKVFLYQSIGFLAIITVCMLDELVGLSSLIMGHQPYICDFRESILKMLLILAVWLPVATSTRRALEHIRHLEGFMKVCAWCHRIDFKGRWMPLEEFFEQGFDTPTTHGICQECLEKQKAAIERARRMKGESPSPAMNPDERVSG